MASVGSTVVKIVTQGPKRYAETWVPTINRFTDFAGMAEEKYPDFSDEKYVTSINEQTRRMNEGTVRGLNVRVRMRSRRRRVGGNGGRRVVRRRQAGYLRVGGYFGRYNKGAFQELKFHDVDFDNNALTTAGEILPSLNLIAQGVGQSQRLGRKVLLKSLHMRGMWFVANGTDPSGCSAISRIIVYCDKQANGAAATVAGILQTADFQSFRNLENQGRFKVLYDKTNRLQREAAGSAIVFANVKHYMKLNKKLNIPILFDGATGAITEMCCNNIGILTITDTVTNIVAGFQCKIRLRFEG